MRKKESKKNNSYIIGNICGIIQISISAICLIYNIIIGADIIIWLLFLCSGICILFGNIIENKK